MMFFFLNSSLAGLMLKANLFAKDSARMKQLRANWAATDPAVKHHVKHEALKTLHSPVGDASRQAAQVIAKIAALELPLNEWPDLIASLLNNVLSPHPHVREASLKTLGFVCEEISEIETEVNVDANKILTAIIQGMQSAETHDGVKLAATNALHNALEFIEANFDVPDERNIIMTVVCECTAHSNPANRVAALECLVRIAELYYQHLTPYMTACFSITLEAIKGSDENAALQAIEFWSAIAEEETSILQELSELEDGETASRTSNNYTLGAMPHLLPILLHALMRQSDDDPDDDVWNVATSAATCIAMMAACVGDPIMQPVMVFVQENISNEAEWRRREAAITAFGAILEGPSEASLLSLVGQGINIMILRINDAHPHVKDTAVWALARICETFASEVVKSNFEAILKCLLDRMQDTPRIAQSACWGLYNLFQEFQGDIDKPEDTNALSRYFQQILVALLYVVERPDSGSGKLRNSAFETVNALVRAAASDVFPLVTSLVNYAMERMNKTFQLSVAHRGGREDQSQIQADLASVLQTLTQKLGPLIAPFANDLMTLFINVFHTNNTTVHEEALLAVGALARVIKADFARYLPAFVKVLLTGLSNVSSSQVCTVAVGALVDLCHADLGKELVPFCDEIVNVLLNDLRSPELDQSLRAPILACFGDIAMAIGGHFEKYVNVVLAMLSVAAATEVDMTNPELFEYICELRASIFETYTGILHGLDQDHKQELLGPYVVNIFDFICAIAVSKRDEHVTTVACGLLGDVTKILRDHSRAHLQKPAIARFLAECVTSHDEDIRSTGLWAQQIIAK